MKTILIETVLNGWIVRPFQPSPCWPTEDLPAIAVYNKFEELQADLHKLMGQPKAVTVITTDRAVENHE